MDGDAVAWLPSLVLLNDSDGDWNTFLDVVYSYFVEDFVNNKPRFQGRRLGLK